MTGRNANIYFPEQTYNKLRQVAGVKISRFVAEAVEEKIEREEHHKKKEFQKKLIADYKSVAKNKKIQQEAAIWDETINDAWNKKYSRKAKKMNSNEFPQEGDIWLVKFDKLKEFSKPYRPCLVVSNDAQNQFDENIVVVGLTTDEMEKLRTFEVYIKNSPGTGLDEPSKICCNYLHTVNKKLRLVDKQRLGVVNREVMEKVKVALKVVLNLRD